MANNLQQQALPEEQLLAEEQQQDPTQLSQVGIQQQPTNLYQTLGGMNPQEMMQLKHSIGVFKNRREIIRNVGDKRAAELITDVEKGVLTINDALERSKKELSPNMRTIDKKYYDEKTTSQDYLKLKEQFSNKWTKTERNLWVSHYNSLLRRESADTKAQIAIDKALTSRQKNDFNREQDNITHALKAHVDYTNIENAVYSGFKDLFVTDKYGNIIEDDKGKAKIKSAMVEGKATLSMSQEDLETMNKHMDVINNEIAKDLNPETYRQGDQIAMQKSLSVIANLTPESYLRAKRGIIVGDEFIPTYDVVKDIGTLRKLYFDSLNALLSRAKDHISNIKRPSGGAETDIETPASAEADPWSQYMIQ